MHAVRPSNLSIAGRGASSASACAHTCSAPRNTVPGGTLTNWSFRMVRPAMPTQAEIETDRSVRTQTHARGQSTQSPPVPAQKAPIAEKREEAPPAPPPDKQERGAKDDARRTSLRDTL